MSQILKKSPPVVYRNPFSGAGIAVLICIALTACAWPPAPPPRQDVPPSAPALRGGVLATFDVVGDQFKVWVTNPEAIQQILDLRDGKSEANIPNGRILRGQGEANHNAPYAWHLDPQEIEMAEMTIEVCDAEPSYVEANVAEFVDNVKRYCPWSAKLVSVQDLR